jgi:hypothetical protein
LNRMLQGVDQCDAHAVQSRRRAGAVNPHAARAL